MTRHRTKVTGEQAAVTNRIQKTLEDANIKLASVATDIMGVSGRAMLKAIISGQEDPKELANLAQRRLREKIPQLKLALEGRVTGHHRFMLETLLDQWEYLASLIKRLDDRIEDVMRPFGESVELLKTIPGVDNVPPKTLSLKLGQIWVNSLPQNIWHRGQGCVLAIMKAPAKGKAALHQKAPDGFAASCASW